MGELAAAIDHVAAGLAMLRAAGVTPTDSVDALAVIREAERLGRQLDAVRVDVIDALDRTELYRTDGHHSAKVMARHVGRLSDNEAKRRAAVATALRDLPAVAAGHASGIIGTCQVSLIARVHANTRVRAKLIEIDTDVARSAAHRSYPEFERRLRNWEAQTDEDGCADRNQRRHENRDAKLVQDFDTSWTLMGGCGALQGAVMHDIFKHFIDAEFAADFDAARAAWGDAAASHLDRNDNQRRFDALYAIFTKAADALAAEHGGSRIDTNIVIDQATFERTAAKLFGTNNPEPRTIPFDPDLDVDLSEDDARAETSGSDDEDATEVRTSGVETTDEAATPATEPKPNPSTDVGYRCSTLDGRPLEPTEAVATALLGHIRRVVVGADSTVIDLGRRRRLFTGAAQLAVKLGSTWCYWPGCYVPVTACQSDHLDSWARLHGRTNPGNGGPACGKHNRRKEHGYTAHRDQAGTWHVRRPDGTEIP